jgi:transcriptional regulator with PAS, ATPase and Fis domain
MQSVAMRRLDRVVRTVANKDVSITLIGESGTGKEIFARRVHELSRRTGPFVPINCAAIPEALFESELFGHEKGAFTGASERALGKVEASHRGTLFFDEIGEMPLGVQSKLLRFLENRRFMRVGGTTKISVDSRIVCATLRPLEEEVKEGRFRADLYYRIQGISLKVPPLRERRADVPRLVHQLLAHMCSKHAIKAPRLSRAAMAALRQHDWPGNVRELRNVIELVCLLRSGRQVRLRDLPEPLRRAQAEPPGPAQADGLVEVRLSGEWEDIVKQVLNGALDLEHGNRTRAAERLGISLRTVQRYLER